MAHILVEWGLVDEFVRRMCVVAWEAAAGAVQM